uniref:Uncharacterized protein n=1 Tax=Cacopsylla melanoneura TaxID=428564 RepID=A0A8D8RLK3_9HEMI
MFVNYPPLINKLVFRERITSWAFFSSFLFSLSFLCVFFSFLYCCLSLMNLILVLCLQSLQVKYCQILCQEHNLQLLTSWFHHLCTCYLWEVCNHSHDLLVLFDSES